MQINSLGISRLVERQSEALNMYDGKSVVDDSGNSGSCSLPSENWAHEPEGVQQPPPYSQVASSSQFSNQPMQQQQMWNPPAAQGIVCFTFATF